MGAAAGTSITIIISLSRESLINRPSTCDAFHTREDIQDSRTKFSFLKIELSLGDEISSVWFAGDVRIKKDSIISQI